MQERQIILVDASIQLNKYELQCKFVFRINVSQVELKMASILQDSCLLKRLFKIIALLITFLQEEQMLY